MLVFPLLYNSTQSSYSETPEDIWEDYSFHILTVATDESKASKLLESSHNIINLGKDVLWEGGTMQGPGGGQKVNLIREGLNNYNDNDIVMFVDGYDTFIHASEDEILKRYFGFRTEVVFSAEKTCWPDKSIADRFPETGGYKYLNSGTFIGTVGTLKKIFADQVENHSDDQLYCQNQYLSGNFNITLDYESYIFFCLAGLEKNCSYNQTNDFVINNETNCTSCIVHGNGGEYTKESFNSLYYQINEYRIYIPTQEYKDLHVLDRDILLLHNFLSEEFFSPAQLAHQ